MYVGNNRKGEYASKREALLKETQEKLRLDNLKKEAFKNALWADDIEKNTINLKRASSSIGTQTINLDEFNREVKERRNMSKEDGDIGDVDDTFSDIDDSDYQNMPLQLDDVPDREVDVDMDETDKRQVESYSYIKALFSKFTELATMGIRPIMGNTGKFYNKKGKTIYIGKDAHLETETGRKSKIDIDGVDWERTESYVNDILNFKQRSNGSISKSINKQIMMNAFKENLIEKRNEEHERYAMDNEDMHVSYKSETDISGTYKEALEKLLLNPQNRKFAKQIGITPYDKNGSDRLRKNYRFHWQNDKLILYSDEQGKTARPTPAVERDQISWYHTFNSLFDRAEKEKIMFDTTGTSIISRKGAYNSKRRLSDSAVSEGTYRPPAKSSRPAVTLTPNFEDEIKTKFRFHPSISELKISPIVKLKDGPEQFEQRYIFNHNGDLVYREKPDKLLTSTDRLNLKKTIRWGSTHNYIMNEIGELYNRLINIDPAHLSASDRARIANLERTLRKSTPMETSAGHGNTDINEFSARRAGRGLTGRGLRGAGAELTHRRQASVCDSTLRIVRKAGVTILLGSVRMVLGST